MTVRVAVIGAGAAGLCAVRHLSAHSQEFQAVCFEKNTRPGGTWIYTDKTGLDENGLPVHSSMYKNLKTNLPKEVMAFPDFPFKKCLPSFIRHEDVQDYLESYASHFNLLKYIKFSTLVNFVHPVKEGNCTSWQVTYCSLGNKEQMVTEMFDAVMVCNGHYAIPLMPTISGLDEFKGQVMHSHSYRYPDIYQGKTVVCLGAAASGQDICVDISSAAEKVYLSHNKKPLVTVVPNNVFQKPGIQRLTERSVIFNDGEECEIDAILFCTGYKFDFPFLSEACHLKIEDERITPLYKHLIHTEHPTLSIVGILKTICPFPNFHNQVLFVLAALSGTLKLPSEQEMNEDTERDYQGRLNRGMPSRYAHTMGSLQWRYNDDLAVMAKFPLIPKVVEELYDEVHRIRVMDIVGYKSVNYELIGEDRYQILEQ